MGIGFYRPNMSALVVQGDSELFWGRLT